MGPFYPRELPPVGVCGWSAPAPGRHDDDAVDESNYKLDYSIREAVKLLQMARTEKLTQTIVTVHWKYGNIASVTRNRSLRTAGCTDDLKEIASAAGGFFGGKNERVSTPHRRNVCLRRQKVRLVSLWLCPLTCDLKMTLKIFFSNYYHSRDDCLLQVSLKFFQ